MFSNLQMEGYNDNGDCSWGMIESCGMRENSVYTGTCSFCDVLAIGEESK